ncbi:MAG: hypothetical protein WDZ59_11770 [Pirellulales bacterium]
MTREDELTREQRERIVHQVLCDVLGVSPDDDTPRTGREWLRMLEARNGSNAEHVQ